MSKEISINSQMYFRSGEAAPQTDEDARTIRRCTQMSQIEDQTPVIESRAPEIHCGANYRVSLLVLFSICANLRHPRIQKACPH
jgi:hypothetical protein